MKKHHLTTKYVDLIKSGKMTKTEINSMRKALGHCSRLPSEKKQSIIDAFQNMQNKTLGIKITPEHTEQGINFLKRTAFRTNGAARNTKDYPFSDHDLGVLRNFKEFRLVGLETFTNVYGNIMSYESEWKVKSKSGDSFTYICGHWGKIQITGRGFKKGTL